MRWVDEIYKALVDLDGAARYADLYEYVEKTTKRDLTPHWKATIRRTVETYSRDSANFAGEDMFEHLDRGFWGIRDFQVGREFIEQRAAMSSREIVERVLVREHTRGYPTADRSLVRGPLFHMVANGPRPVAPFSHAVEEDGWVLVTGQMPTDPTAPDAPLPAGIEAQTQRVMSNLALVLAGIGMGFEHVRMCRCYLTHFERDYAAFNRVYAGYFPPDRRPARTTIGVTALALGALVEIDLVARRPAP